jgi:hypothetical protein
MGCARVLLVCKGTRSPLQNERSIHSTLPLPVLLLQWCASGTSNCGTDARSHEQGRIFPFPSLQYLTLYFCHRTHHGATQGSHLSQTALLSCRSAGPTHLTCSWQTTMFSSCKQHRSLLPASFKCKYTGQMPAAC